eukprot:403373413
MRTFQIEELMSIIMELLTAKEQIVNYFIQRVNANKFEFQPQSMWQFQKIQITKNIKIRQYLQGQMNYDLAQPLFNSQTFTSTQKLIKKYPLPNDLKNYLDFRKKREFISYIKVIKLLALDDTNNDNELSQLFVFHEIGFFYFEDIYEAQPKTVHTFKGKIIDSQRINKSNSSNHISLPKCKNTINI